jgi:hypothetical protein
VAFDLDDTLAPSKSAVPADIVAGLAKLLETMDVCVISGGRFEQFENQLLSSIDPGQMRTEGLHIMPTCGTQYFHWNHGWKRLYAEDLADAEKADAAAALEAEAKELGFWTDETWGPCIEDRGTQVTYSALGQSAPVEEKRKWDPSGKKRELLRRHVQQRLPALEVRAGGSTSIDVTRKGIDKAYGIRRLSEAVNVSLADMLFVGDRLEAGGNDYAVRTLGVKCIAVAGWHETERAIAWIMAGEWPGHTLPVIEA